MRTILPQLKGITAVFLIALNTLIHFPFVIFFGILKFIVPLRHWRNIFTHILAVVCECWTDVNNFNINRLLPFTIDADLPENLNRQGNYLLIANHQSWTDIIVLQMLFNRRIPFFRFFLKSQLLYVPLLGFAWWALDYPFMKRYSQDTVRKKPHLAGKDLEITRKACEKYKDMPISIVIFPEGTRFTVEKHNRQNSPYTHLLKPRAGGIGYIMHAIGTQLDAVLDITIRYEETDPTFWKFLTGRLKRAHVTINRVSVDSSVLQSNAVDDSYRERYRAWINTLWKDKDARLSPSEKTD